MASENNLFKKLVDFAIPDFYDSLLLLFTSRDAIPRFPYADNTLMVIHGVKNLSKDDHEIIHMVEKRWQNQIQNLRQENSLPSSDVAPYLNNLSELLEHPSRLFAPVIGKDVIEAATSDFIQECISKYRVQSDLFDNPDVIKHLSKRFGILEPWFQANLCSTCEVFEMLFSTLPEKDTECPKCTAPMKTIRIYKFNSELEKLKLNNQDLPEFIKTYLSSSLSDPSIVSSYQLNGPQGGDIDVYIPISKTGIECKLFVHSYAEGNSLDSRISDIMVSLKKYVESGKTERLIVIINLAEEFKERIESEIKNNLKKNSLPFTHVKVVCNSVQDLLSVLNEEIQFYRSSPQLKSK